MICVGVHPFHLPARVEPSIEEAKDCPCYCLLIIMSFLCVPNQDKQRLLLFIALPLVKVFIAKESGQINLSQAFSSILTLE